MSLADIAGEQSLPKSIDEQNTKLFELVTKFIDENPEPAEAASNALDAILRTHSSDDATTPPSFSVGDLPSPDFTATSN